MFPLPPLSVRRGLTARIMCQHVVSIMRLSVTTVPSKNKENWIQMFASEETTFTEGVESGSSVEALDLKSTSDRHLGGHHSTVIPQMNATFFQS